AGLEGWSLRDLNGRYASEPADGQDLHRPPGPDPALGETLCVQEERVVGHDWCVRWANRWLQIEAGHAALNLPRRRVLVRELSDGRLLLDYRGQRLSFTELTARPAPVKPKKPVINNRRWKPGESHPWKSGPAVGPRRPVVRRERTGSPNHLPLAAEARIHELGRRLAHAGQEPHDLFHPGDRSGEGPARGPARASGQARHPRRLRLHRTRSAPGLPAL